MQQQIDEMLAIDKKVPLKAQELCEKLISESFHDFFKAIIEKINQLSRSLPHLNQNNNKEEYESLKRLVFILNRQLCAIIKNLSKQDEDKILQIWNVINQVLMQPDLNFSVLHKLIPSISGFMSSCNDKEVKFIFFNNNANNENSQAEIVLLMALIESKVPKKTICIITKKLLQQFQKDLVLQLQKLQENLQNIEQEQQAIDMVCNTVNRWSKYLEIFIKILQLSKHSFQMFDSLKNMINSNSFLKIMNICLQIDKYLLLKQNQVEGENSGNSYRQVQYFKLLLKSKYNRVNKCINCLKASTLKILRIIVEIIFKSSTNGNFDQWKELTQFVSNQIIYPGVSDFYLLGKYELKNTSNDSLTSNSLELVRQLASMISSLTQIEVFRQMIETAIHEFSKQEIEYIFFACICNIQRFETRNFQNTESLIVDLQNSKGFNKNKNFFISNFTHDIIPLSHLEIQNFFDFATDILILMLDSSISISQFFQEKGISQCVQIRFQSQTLSLYLYLLQNISKSQHFRKYDQSMSSKFLDFIDLMTFNFEKLPINLKNQFLSLCLNFSHLWTQKPFSKCMDKFFKEITAYFRSQKDQINLMLQFCYSAIILLVLEDVQMRNQRPQKNSQLVLKFFQCLARFLKSIRMSQIHDGYKILSDLVLNDIWITERSAFDGNFIIFEICYRKIEDLEIHLKNELSIEKKEVENLLPKQDFLDLFGNCILSLQQQFDSEDQCMQVKISSMRQMVIKSIHFLSLFTDVFSQNELGQICQTLQFLSGTHLEEKISADLCLIIKSDGTLVDTIIQFLGAVKEIGRSYLGCVCNLIISFEGEINKNFIFQVFAKIRKSLYKIQSEVVDDILLRQILSLINLIFLYEMKRFIESNDFKEICKAILITGKNEGISILYSERESQKFGIKTENFNQMKIKLLITKCFIFSAKYKKESNLNPKQLGIKQKKFSSLVPQFKDLMKKMSLEDLTYFLFAVETSIQEAKGQTQKELILELGSQFYYVLKQKKAKIPMFLKKRFNPVIKIKHMIFELTNKFRNDFTNENLISIKELENELDSFELETPAPRNVISLRKRKSNLSSQELPKNQDQDIII